MEKKIGYSVFLILLCFAPFLSAQDALYKISSGKVYFQSDAPLEIIEASSKSLRGAIDTQKKTFAFTIPMRSFEGFNSALQQEHFNENYLESTRFPDAVFTGKIIEQVDFDKEGTYTIRAKGKLTIHGITRERIIKSELNIQKEGFSLKSEFTVFLKEYDINIPKIVYQKIAEEILVRVEGAFIKS